MNTKKRWWVALEVIFVFGLVMVQIWILPRSFIAITAFLVLVFVMTSFRHCPKEMALTEYLGLGKFQRLDNKVLGRWSVTLDWSQAGKMFWATLVGIAAMAALALLINYGFWQKPKFWDKIWDELRNYLMCWALIQQFAMQGYVANRLEIVCQKRWLTAFLTGGLFAIAHYPNPILMPGTFILGSVGAYFFLKARNLYLLAIVHSILGTAVKYLLAYDLLDHSMRVGPGFWE